MLETSIDVKTEIRAGAERRQPQAIEGLSSKLVTPQAGTRVGVTERKRANL
jgi:hypothetical protein